MPARTSHYARARIQMPNEILMKIFTDSCYGPINTCDNSSPIWVLQDVCAHWREILKSMPKLWCNFEVGEPRVGMNTVASRVQACLDFSQETPLSVALTLRFLVLDEDKSAYYKMCTDIVEHANRFISLTLSATLFQDLMEQKSLNFKNILYQCGLKQLHRLSIIAIDYAYDAGRLFGIFKSPDALEEIEFIRSALLRQDTLPFAWDRIKRIGFESCRLRYDSAFENFSQASSLEVLTWEESNIDFNGEDPDRRPVALPSLHTFILENFPLRYDLFEGNHISAPSLQNVHILEIEDFSDIKECRFWNMIKSANIKRLHLETVTQNVALEIMKALPSVEELIITENDDWAGILDLLRRNLADDPESPNLLPKLRKLEFFEYLDGDEFVPYMEQIMHSRSSSAESWNSLDPLESVTCIVHMPLAEDPELTSLKHLGRELGIKVEVFKPNLNDSYRNT